MPELIISGPDGRLEARYHHETAIDSPIAPDPAPPPLVTAQLASDQFY
jgi:hypothetical protein